MGSILIEAFRVIRRGMLTCCASMVTVAILFGGFTGVGQASIIEFDQIRDATGTVIPTISGNAVELDYGDRITASVMNVPGGQFTYGNGGEGFTLGW